MPNTNLNPANDVVARTAAIAALGLVALVHVLQLPDAFAAIDYLGLLFIVVILGCLGLAALLTHRPSQQVWTAAGALPGLVLLGYLLSRTAGLPGFTDDVGEWTEPLGLISMVVEGFLVVLIAPMLEWHRLAAEPTPARPVGA